MNYEDNFPLQDVMDPYKEELVVYADEVYRLNKNGKLEKRTFLLTDRAMYIIMRAVKKKIVTWSVTRRTAMTAVGSISLSTMADSYVVIHVPGDHDAVLECDRKTELIMLLREAFKNQTNRDLPLNFNDTINYVAKEGDTKQKTLQFFRDEVTSSFLHAHAHSTHDGGIDAKSNHTHTKTDGGAPAAATGDDGSESEKLLRRFSADEDRRPDWPPSRHGHNPTRIPQQGAAQWSGPSRKRRTQPCPRATDEGTGRDAICGCLRPRRAYG